jgi:hypothetical protein
MVKQPIGIIVGPDVGNEAEAIRQTAEYFGFQVIIKHLGRPNDFIQILAGQDQLLNSLKIWIFSVHGGEGQFLLPELDDSVYEPNEPRGKLGATHIRSIAKLKKQTIINTGCTLGHQDLAQAFLSTGAKAYIGVNDYVEGNASLLFVHRLLYELANKVKLPTAFKKASKIDQETALFQLFLP